MLAAEQVDSLVLLVSTCIYFDLGHCFSCDVSCGAANGVGSGFERDWERATFAYGYTESFWPCCHLTPELSCVVSIVSASGICIVLDVVRCLAGASRLSSTVRDTTRPVQPQVDVVSKKVIRDRDTPQDTRSRGWRPGGPSL